MRQRWNGYREKVTEKVKEALREEHSHHETAFSAAIGTFLTVLPTFGVGILIFLVLAKISDRINKVALFACVVVFNPIVKYPIYILSYWIGKIALKARAPSDPTGVDLTQQALQATQTILIGNIILAVVLAVVAYLVTLKVSIRFHDQTAEIREELAEKI